MSNFSIAHEIPPVTEASEACNRLAYSICPLLPSGQSKSVVIAFTSATRGEGVTYITRSVMRAMNEICPGRTQQIDMDWLRRQPQARPIQPSGPDGESGHVSGAEYRRYSIERLRLRFQFSAIDCPALGMSADVLSIATLVDGVVLVVEADRTKKSKIRNAERQIEGAGGKILGLVLNKRRYPVPSVIYNLL